MTAAHAFILLGGLVGFDGYADSIGMELLAQTIKWMGVETSTYTWTDWESAWQAIADLSHETKVILIGYSGGGTRATYLANKLPHLNIDLMVLYDPSPKWQMEPIGSNVKRALCYHNTNPMMPSPYGELGGGVLSGSVHIETVDVSEQHLLVQFNKSLHDRTVMAVNQCLETA